MGFLTRHDAAPTLACVKGRHEAASVGSATKDIALKGFKSGDQEVLPLFRGIFFIFGSKAMLKSLLLFGEAARSTDTDTHTHVSVCVCELEKE